MMRFPALHVCAVLVVFAIIGSVAVTPRSVGAAPATAAADLELRASPAADAAVVLVVPTGAPLSLDGPPQGDFYPVTFDGTSGWVPAAGLVVEKEPTGAIDPEPLGGEPAPVIPTMTTVAPVDPVVPSPTVPTAATVAPTLDPAEATLVAAEATLVATFAPLEPTVVPLEPTAIPTSGLGEPTAGPSSSAPTSTVPPAATAIPTASEALSPSETGTAEAVPTATTAADATATSSPTTEAVPTEESSPSEEPLPTAEPTPTATPRPVIRGPATATVNLSLVAQPIAGAEILFTVPAGSTLTRMGSYVNGFVSADFMGILGWVDFGLLAEPLLPEPEPEPEPSAERTPSVAAEATATERSRREPTAPAGVGGPGSGVAYTANDLSLRSGPSAGYPELSSIPAGETVALTGVMEGGFVRVEYGGEIGWVSTSLLGMPPDPTPETARRGDESPRVYSREEIVQVIYAAADRYGQPRADMLRVAECESNLDPYAVNASGSYGLFQFVGSTWESTPYANKEIFDPRANANAAAWMWSVGRRNEWVCQ